MVFLAKFFNCLSSSTGPALCCHSLATNSRGSLIFLCKKLDWRGLLALKFIKSLHCFIFSLLNLFSCNFSLFVGICFILSSLVIFLEQGLFCLFDLSFNSIILCNPFDIFNFDVGQMCHLP